jgi:hypothetical protein
MENKKTKAKEYSVEVVTHDFIEKHIYLWAE